VSQRFERWNQKAEIMS